MSRKMRGDECEVKNIFDGFMFRIAGVTDEVVLCKHMVDLLNEIREVFMKSPVPHKAFEVLERAGNCTDEAFRGESCKDLFDVYYQLGVILMDLGQEDLGVSCQFLHHAYRNRAMIQWPPAKAWYKGRGDMIVAMLPIFEVSFESLEADTAKDADCVSV